MPLQSKDFFVHRYRFWKKRFRNWISAQPRISGHFELAPILKAEKVNKRPPNPPSSLLLPIKFNTVSAYPHPTHVSDNELKMNDFPVIGDPCFAHRILGSPGGKHCESLQRNVWRGVVSPLKAVSLDRECRILPWFYEKRRLRVKFMFTEFTQWSTWRKGLEIYSTNLGIHVGGLAHLSV